jgi:hypothetical protein
MVDGAPSVADGAASSRCAPDPASHGADLCAPARFQLVWHAAVRGAASSARGTRGGCTHGLGSPALWSGRAPEWLPSLYVVFHIMAACLGACRQCSSTGMTHLCAGGNPSLLNASWQ